MNKGKILLISLAGLLAVSCVNDSVDQPAVAPEVAVAKKFVNTSSEAVSGKLLFYVDEANVAQLESATSVTATGIEAIDAVIAKINPVANFYRVDFMDALMGVETLKWELAEESEAFKTLDAAINAAYEYDMSAVTTVEELEAVLIALNEALKVIPSEVALDQTEVTLDAAGATVELVATVSEEDADKAVVWTSSDEAVATVDENGVVTAVANGTATITVSTVNGLTATCVVTVEIVPNGIENVDADAELIIYDIHGRRVTEMTKGLYIVNGKKVIVK